MFFFENDPVEKELKVLICVIYAKLFKAVEGKILQSTKKSVIQSNAIQILPQRRVLAKPFTVVGKQVYSAIPRIHRYQGWR